MKLTIKLAVAALAATALLAPSTAMAGKSHLLKLYKVEKHVDLEGQDFEYNVECKGTDLALDGMWRVDDVEQDNDYSFPSFSTGNPAWDVLRAVRPVEVESDGDSSYDFEFIPESGGDVQLKLIVTCLGRTAETIGGHTHTWTLTHHGPVMADDAAPANRVRTGSCASGILVQPGFDVEAGDADLVTSRPANLTGTTWQWRWDFVGASPFQAEHTWSCLNLKSGSGGSPAHVHRIVRQLRTNDPAAPYNSTLASSPPAVKKESTAEVQMHCGEHYKGMVGGWDVGPGSPGYGFLWYLGMDPRIKSRAYRFINTHNADLRANLYLVCFKDKTT